jgi:hypothetical protein
MLNNILTAQNDYTGLILRLSLGGVILPHGAQNYSAYLAAMALVALCNFLQK